MMTDCSIHKVSFLNFNFIASTVFENFRLFFKQLIFTHEIGKCPKHSGSESLPLLRNCRDPMESEPSPWNIEIKKIGDSYVIAATWPVLLCAGVYSQFNLYYSLLQETSLGLCLGLILKKFEKRFRSSVPNLTHQLNFQSAVQARVGKSYSASGLTECSP